MIVGALVALTALGVIIACAVITKRSRVQHLEPRWIDRTELETFQLELELCEDPIGALEEERGEACQCPA
ncbi:hypothetical protein LWC34_38970 [Kibdelosporangium philippinense]|uniref:Uncharacterized protein n=1 Tax=Kibdelosporangium philippinense TaxID=211113 RepID=A0ABS8ZLS3_9PSEU|nr:hypothetical protein [Kibdelosporangium philippinense]MCE7008753.1 hypothetical protein [Kibdelosporangium philippinense]